jgi:hypothetical protein
MQNIEVKVDPKTNVATFSVDLSKRFGRSASGKTVIVATSSGNQDVPGHPEIKFGINVYTK